MHIICIHSALSVHLHTWCILFWHFLKSLHKVCIKCLLKVCICRLNAHSLSLRSLNLAYALKSAKSLHYCLHQVCNCRLHAHLLSLRSWVCIKSAYKVCKKCASADLMHTIFADYKVCKKCAWCRLCRRCADLVQNFQQNPCLSHFGAPAVPTACVQMSPNSANLENLPKTTRF